MGRSQRIKDIPVYLRTSLELFELGRPADWKHENLLKRSLQLAKYARKLTLVIFQDRKRISELAQQVTQAEEAQFAAEAQVKRLQEVASAAAWVIADHMSGSYNAVIGPGNKHINSEQHGDGICRVLALHLSRLEDHDMDGVEGFVDDDFNRTYGLLHRNLPEDIRR